MDKILVTGGCGLIGQHICSGLLKKGYDVIAVDRKASTYNEGKLRYTFIEASPDDKIAYRQIFDMYKFDIIIHCACTADNDFENKFTEQETIVSDVCDRFIFQYSMEKNVKKFILMSTDQVYEFKKSREPIREDNELKPVSNYAVMKYNSEKALISEMKRNKNVMCCIVRFAPIYTKNFIPNLETKITDPKDNVKFVYGKGQYGFQFCCLHNLVDFILCYLKSATDMTYAGIYNVADKHLTTATDIIDFMRENYGLGTVIQKTPGGAFSKLKGLFSGNKEDRTDYRWLDMSKLENNNMLDTTRASKFTAFRWDLNNTK